MKKGKEVLKRRKLEEIKENPIFCDEYQKQRNKTKRIMRAMQHNMDKHQFYMTLPLGRFWGGFNSNDTEKSKK